MGNVVRSSRDGLSFQLCTLSGARPRTLVVVATTRLLTCAIQGGRAMSSPAIRGFQIDASAIGDAQASVNLFRGDVNFPLKLVSLAGPNGLDLNLSAFYTGAPSLQVDTWNLDAPTGVLGLGWSLPYDFIEFQHSGTASYLEGRFLAHLNGRPGELVLVSWTNRSNTKEQLEFADPGHPLWQYTYQTQEEVWTVKRDDGVTMTF